MSSNPWGKFFWTDWETDPALMQCSLAAQALWMRMLCICAKANPCGYLAVNGKPLAVSAVAKRAGISVEEAGVLMSELEEWGVFSRDRKGTIYSRRMIRDAKRAEKGQKAARKRWAQPLEKPDAFPQPIGSPWKEPEARSQVDTSSDEDVRARDARATPSTRKPTTKSELEVVLDAEHAESVIAHRKMKRAGLTPRAAKLLAAKFARTTDPNAAADEMIAAGWTSFEPEWLEGRNVPHHGPGPPGRVNGSAHQRVNEVFGRLFDEIDRRGDEGNGEGIAAAAGRLPGPGP